MCKTLIIRHVLMGSSNSCPLHFLPHKHYVSFNFCILQEFSYRVVSMSNISQWCLLNNHHSFKLYKLLKKKHFLYVWKCRFYLLTVFNGSCTDIYYQLLRIKLVLFPYSFIFLLFCFSNFTTTLWNRRGNYQHQDRI